MFTHFSLISLSVFDDVKLACCGGGGVGERVVCSGVEWNGGGVEPVPTSERWMDDFIRYSGFCFSTFILTR